MDSIQSLFPYALPAIIVAGSAYFFLNKKSKFYACVVLCCEPVIDSSP